MNFSIDEFRLADGFIHLRGWALGRPRFNGLTLVIPEEAGLRHRLKSYGLPSADVASVVGSDGASVRFQEILPCPSNLSISNIVNGKIEFESIDGNIGSIQLFDVDHAANMTKNIFLDKITIGIGVTTYNRKDSLIRTLDKINEHTRMKYDLVVADDGSTDGTRAILDMRDIACIGGRNRGIAWNKNRCLFYLSHVKKCDVIIVIEDDVFPSVDGWEADWVFSALLYGHVNYLPHWLEPFVLAGTGAWHKPYVLQDVLSGQCAAFSASAISWVGFLDTRFGQYGHEHVEHTLRMVRAGFGGYPVQSKPRSACFYAIKGNVEVCYSISYGSIESVERNGRIYDTIWNESIHRWAWRNDDEFKVLRNEIDSMQSV
jgi:GT2 family glycosyltransferase